MTEHAKLSPSSAHRWLNCSESLLYPAGAPGPEAIEGTKKHAEAAMCLSENKDSDNPDVQFYVDYVRSLYNPGFLRYVEKKVTLLSVSSKIFGTADAIVLNPFVNLTVVDFKTGKQEVEAFKNPQLMIYALAAYDTLQPAVEDIELVIVQPPSYDKIKIWKTRYSEIKTLAPKIKTVYEDYEKGVRTPVTGDWCQWCTGASQCPAILKALPELKSPENVSEVEKIVQILNAEKGIREAYKLLKQKAKDLILGGIEVPGYKVVESFGYRVWGDELKVCKKVGKRKATKNVILSPAQFEKAHPELKEWVKDNTYRLSKGPTLVPEKDKRKAVSTKDTLKLAEALPQLED